MSGWFDTIWADDLPSRAVTVYMYLRSRADREGKCFPSVRTISRDTKLSMSTVRRALDDLVNAGYIQKQDFNILFHGTEYSYTNNVRFMASSIIP